jgi:hypothetical protein
MAQLKMTERDEQLILELRVDKKGNQRGSRAIAALLAEEYGREFHFSTVAGVLRRHRLEREEIVRGVLAEKLGQTITADLTTLDEVLRHEMEVWLAGKPKIGIDGRVTAQNDVPLYHWTGLGREIREVVAKRLELAGASRQEPDDELSSLSDADLERELDAARRVVNEGGAVPDPPA